MRHATEFKSSILPCSASVPKCLCHRRRTQILCLRQLLQAAATYYRAAAGTAAAANMHTYTLRAHEQQLL